MTIVARYLTPTEAHILRDCLVAGGVPAGFVAEARDVIAAFKRGDFALDENFDAGDTPR